MLVSTLFLIFFDFFLGESRKALIHKGFSAKKILEGTENGMNSFIIMQKIEKYVEEGEGIDK